MTASSATAGQPARPSRPEATPSFICAPSVSLGSWACCAMTPSKALTYSSARRISTASDTQRPSSENTRTRAAESAIAPNSASLDPPSPTVTAPTGCTSQWPAARPSRQICSVTPAVSATGSVLAIACTAVNPPSAAARVPVSMVSASSRPGSRRWVCRSTSPGSAISPARVEHLRAWRGAVAPGPTAAIGAVGEGDVGGLAAQRPRTPDDPPAGRWPRPVTAPTSSPPSSRYSTAIRTLTPLATCSTIVDLGESATSAAISTPRFIGPGCITMASSGSCRSRAVSSP